MTREDLKARKERKMRRVEPSERAFEVVELVKENGENFVLVKIRLEDLSKLAVLKTERKRREYQREAQKRYRKKLAAKRED